jgi:hypothetical protein
MGDLTLDEAVEEVRYLCGNDKDEDTDRIKRWLKAGLNYITAPNVYRHPELEATETITLVAGDEQTPTLVWNAVEMVQFRDAAVASITATTRSYRLRPTSLRRLLDRSYKTEGQPRRYVFVRNTIITESTIGTSDTGKGLRLEGMCKHRALDYANGAEVTDLRAEWDDLWVMAGGMYGFIWAAESGKAHGLRDSLGRLINDFPIVQDLSAVDETDDATIEAPDPMRPGRHTR